MTREEETEPHGRAAGDEEKLGSCLAFGVLTRRQSGKKKKGRQERHRVLLRSGSSGRAQQFFAHGVVVDVSGRRRVVGRLLRLELL